MGCSCVITSIAVFPGCGDIVAGIDLPQTDAAIDRRNDVAVGQVQLGAIDGRLIAGDGAFEGAERSFQSVQVLLGDDALLVKHFVALVLRFGVGQLGFVLLQVGFGLRQRHLVGTGIDQDQQVSGSSHPGLRENSPA